MGRGMLLRPVREDREVGKWRYPDGVYWDEILVEGDRTLRIMLSVLAAGHLEVDSFGYMDTVGHLDDYTLSFCSSNRCHDANGVTVNRIGYLLHGSCEKCLAVLTVDDLVRWYDASVLCA